MVHVEIRCKNVFLIHLDCRFKSNGVVCLKLQAPLRQAGPTSTLASYFVALDSSKMPIGTVNKSELYNSCEMLNQYLLLHLFCVFVCAKCGGKVANLQGSL